MNPRIKIDMRQYFRFTGNYHLAGHDDQDLPIFKKQSNDITMYYNHEAFSWVIKNSEQNMIFATSSSISPNFVNSVDWNIKIDDEFVNAESRNISFTFQCISMEQDPPQSGESLK